MCLYMEGKASVRERRVVKLLSTMRVQELPHVGPQASQPEFVLKLTL